MVEIEVIVVRARVEGVAEHKAVQKCKSEQGSGAKVEKWRQGRLQSTEDGEVREPCKGGGGEAARLQSTDLGGMR